MEWWHRLVGAAWQLLDEHGLLAAFIFLLVEEAGTPVPIPGDFIMVLTGVRAAQGHLRLGEALLVMELATVIGASILYWLSLRAGRQVVYRLGRYVGLTPERLDRAGDALNRRGAVAVVLGRMTPGLRMATPIAAGIFRFPFRVFFPAMAVSGFVYILGYTLLGYFFGPRIISLLEAIELPMGLLVSTALLLGLAYWTLRVGRYRTPDLCPELRARAWAGAVAGGIATLESGLLANVLIHAFGLVATHAPATAIAELVRVASVSIGRSPGIATFMLLLPACLIVGCVLGAIFGVWLGNAAYGAGWRIGVIYALLPFTASLFVVLPIVGGGPAGLSLGAGIVPAVGELIRHLAYGAILGLLYPALARPPRPEAATSTSISASANAVEPSRIVAKSF